MSFTKPAAEKEKGVLVSLLTQYKENRMHQCKNIARGIVNSVRHLKNNRNTQEKMAYSHSKWVEWESITQQFWCHFSLPWPSKMDCQHWHEHAIPI